MQIQTLPRGFLVLSSDGTVTMYLMNQTQYLKYPTFKISDKIFLGFEKPDAIRQMEVLTLAQTEKQIYGPSIISNPEFKETLRGNTISTDGQATISCNIYPTTCSLNVDDGSLFIGDSLGAIHVLDGQIPVSKNMKNSTISMKQILNPKNDVMIDSRKMG